MSEQENKQAGAIDATDRVMQELLKTPRFKESLKVIINSVDPQSAPGLVRTLMWEDAEVFLDIVGVLPEIINAFILGGKEMLVQAENYPPEMLADYLSQMLDKIDGEALGSSMARGSKLHGQLQEVTPNPASSSLNHLCYRMNNGFQSEMYPGSTGEKNSEHHQENLSQNEEENGATGGSAVLMLSLLQPLIRKQIRQLAVEAKKEGSETQKLIQGLSQTLGEEIKNNPEFVTHVLGPFVESVQAAKSGDQ